MESVIEGAVLYHSLEVLDKGILGSVDAFLDPLCYERKVHRFLYENKKRGGGASVSPATVCCRWARSFLTLRIGACKAAGQALQRLARSRLFSLCFLLSSRVSGRAPPRVTTSSQKKKKSTLPVFAGATNSLARSLARCLFAGSGYGGHGNLTTAHNADQVCKSAGRK